MNLCTTIDRTNRKPPNEAGYFVQNRHVATVAGPFCTRAEAWREEDRREPEERAAMAAEAIAARAAT